MALTLSADPLPLRLDEGGTYRVGPSRIRLDSVVFLYNRGSSAEQIVREFPTLELADVHAIIGYYLRHKADVDAYIQENEMAAEEIRKELEAGGHFMPPEFGAEIKRRFHERYGRKG